MIDCPCGSTKTFAACCALVHQDETLAIEAEQLMRARYSAFATGNVDFAVNTYHSTCNALLDRDGIANSTLLNWVKLEVVFSSTSTGQISKVNSKINSESSTEAFVEFKAWYIQANSTTLHLMHEKSRFVKEQVGGHFCWRYIDGVFMDDKPGSKISRNSLCPCNSGKKYKRCCAL
ncbi:MAG: SEC-C motif-containing protein [Oceanospirillaceae bacterium]|jgi:SEC-C motif-containing protein